MKLTTMLATLSLMTITPAATQDATQLTRTYKEGETSKYKLELKFTSGGMDGSLLAEMDWKVKKLLDGGKVTGSINPVSMKLALGDGNSPDMGSSEFIDEFGPTGMPTNLELNQDQAVFSLFSFSSYLPNKAIKVGDTYPIDWTAKASGVKVQGTGKLVEITKLGETKAYKVDSKVELAPSSGDVGELKVTSWFDAANGQLLKAEGKLTIGEELTANVKVEKKS
ncbi:MAG TPA: hypothetical protein PLH94_00255 [Fimbriimonadaceae bacterium]|nr:hypothetical protein [Fimbriimonadaceae bacterium]